MFQSKKTISVEEEALLLDGRRLPARLTSAEVAVVLGFHEHDIAQLVVSKLLTPLGKPAHNSPKHFATVDIIAAAQKPRMALHRHPPDLPLLAKPEREEEGAACLGGNPMIDVLKEKEPTISFKRKGSSLCRSKHPGDSASTGYHLKIVNRIYHL